MLLLNHTRLNAAFVISFWIFSLGFHIVLESIPPIDMSKPVTTPSILQNISLVVYAIFGAYVMVFLIFMVYDLLLGPKLKKTAENLSAYGIISFVTLTMIFIDLLTIMASESSFLSHEYSTNGLPQWQEIFLHGIFPSVCLVIILALRNQKIHYEETEKHLPI